MDLLDSVHSDDMEPEQPVLTESRWFWPIVLFPYAIEGSHTRNYTGKAVLKGIKASLSRASLELNESAVVVRGHLTGNEHIVIPLEEIRRVDVLEGKPGLIELRFGKARFGRLAKSLTGPPGSRNRVILNVEDTDAWLNEIATRVR